LNEGFATYNEYIAAQSTNQEFEFEARAQNSVQVALGTDGNPAATHPLVNAAAYNNSNTELMVNFDRITYDKGSALARMMEGFLGPDSFKAGLISYLTTM
jgi:aminopeptidase N